MEKVSIEKAAIRLRVSQEAVRRRIRVGELRAFRELGPNGQHWAVELPDAEEADPDAYLREQARRISPWWWTNTEKTGKVHYVENIETEEVVAHHLCWFVSYGVWSAQGHSESDRCRQCIAVAKARALPLEGGRPQQ